MNEEEQNNQTQNKVIQKQKNENYGDIDNIIENTDNKNDAYKFESLIQNSLDINNNKIKTDYTNCDKYLMQNLKKCDPKQNTDDDKRTNQIQRKHFHLVPINMNEKSMDVQQINSTNTRKKIIEFNEDKQSLYKNDVNQNQQRQFQIAYDKNNYSATVKNRKITSMQQDRSLNEDQIEKQIQGNFLCSIKDNKQKRQEIKLKQRLIREYNIHASKVDLSVKQCIEYCENIQSIKQSLSNSQHESFEQLKQTNTSLNIQAQQKNISPILEVQGSAFIEDPSPLEINQAINQKVRKKLEINNLLRQNNTLPLLDIGHSQLANYLHIQQFKQDQSRNQVAPSLLKNHQYQLNKIDIFNNLIKQKNSLLNKSKSPINDKQNKIDRLISQQSDYNRNKKDFYKIYRVLNKSNTIHTNEYKTKKNEEENFINEIQNSQNQKDKQISYDLDILKQKLDNMIQKIIPKQSSQSPQRDINVTQMQRSNPYITKQKRYCPKEDNNIKYFYKQQNSKKIFNQNSFYERGREEIPYDFYNHNITQFQSTNKNKSLIHGDNTSLNQNSTFLEEQQIISHQLDILSQKCDADIKNVKSKDKLNDNNKIISVNIFEQNKMDGCILQDITNQDQQQPIKAENKTIQKQKIKSQLNLLEEQREKKKKIDISFYRDFENKDIKFKSPIRKGFQKIKRFNNIMNVRSLSPLNKNSIDFYKSNSVIQNKDQKKNAQKLQQQSNYMSSNTLNCSHSPKSIDTKGSLDQQNNSSKRNISKSTIQMQKNTITRLDLSPNEIRDKKQRSQTNNLLKQNQKSSQININSDKKKSKTNDINDIYIQQNLSQNLSFTCSKNKLVKENTSQDDQIEKLQKQFDFIIKQNFTLPKQSTKRYRKCAYLQIV